MKRPLHLDVTFRTPVSEGRYTIDGTWYSAEDFCRAAHALEPKLLKHHPEIGPDVYLIATHEAAEVLRQHGHVVGNAQGPQL